MDGKCLIENIMGSILSESHQIVVSGVKFNVKFSKNIELDILEDLYKYVHNENRIFNDDVYYITSILDDNMYEKALSCILDWNFKEEIVIYESRHLGNTVVKKYLAKDSIEVYYCDILNFVVIVDGMKKYLIMCNYTEEYIRQTLRIMKEVIVRFYENNGGMIYHSAAFNLDNKGVILTGFKEAGKTTLLCRMLEAEGIEYISNDKIMITNKLDVIYLPLSMRIGLGTYENFEKLKEYVANDKLDRVQYYNDKKIDCNKLAEKYVKYDFTSKEISKIFNVEPVSSTRLNFLLVPKIKIDGNEIKITKISDEERINIIEGNCITLYNDIWPNSWVEKRTCDDNIIRKNCENLLKKMSQIEFYYVEYGSKVPSQEICAKLREKIFYNLTKDFQAIL